MFNKKLYKEGLRQTFLFGIFMIVISTVINCFIPLNLLIDDNYNRSIYTNNNYNNTNQAVYDQLEKPELIYDTLIEQSYHDSPYNNSNYAYNLSIENANGAMLFLMFIVPLVMIFNQFKFLGSRKACDFYHSIPVTRLSLVFNFSLSALTYTFLCMVIPMLCNMLIYRFIEDVNLNYSVLLPNIIEKVIISFLIYSAFLIGISVSGQFVTTCIIAGNVLFLPRYFISMIISSVDIQTQFLRAGNTLYSNMIGNNYNLLVKKFTSIPDSWSYALKNDTFISSFEEFEKFSYDPIAFVYTLTLAIILFLIGCHLFVKRESEMSGKNTATPLLQHLIRFASVIPVVIFIVYLYVRADFFNKNLSTFLNEILANEILAICIFIFVVYFTYELITTRNMKKLITSAKLFPLVIVFAIGYYAIIVVSSNILLTQSTVNVSNIKSVKLNFYSQYAYNYGYNSMFDEYTLKLIEDYEITNQDVINLVGNAFVNHVETNKTDAIRYYTSSNNFIPITVKTNSKTITRNIFLNEVTLDELFGILLKNEHINTTLLSSLPDRKNVVASQVTSLSQDYYNDAQTQNILDVLYQEYNNLPLDQQLQVVYSSNANYFSATNSYNNEWELNQNLYIELRSTGYTSNGSVGYYKENAFHNYKVNFYNDDSNNTILASNDKLPAEYTLAKMSNYNQNDLPLVLALYTRDNQQKFIYLNELLPETKKLIIDMYMEDNKAQYELFDYFTQYNNDLMVSFNITSLDDYYNLNTQLESNSPNSNNSFDITPTKELLDLLINSVNRDPDYDNMYLVSFTPFLGEKINESYTRDFSLKPIRVLLPFTEEEFYSIILKI